MRVDELQKQWEEFGRPDPMWAVVSDGADFGKQWKPEEFFATGRADVGEWLARLRELGGPASGGRALDFGCGVGRLTQALAAHFDSVVGVDVSRVMLAEAERHNAFPGTVSFVHNSSDDLRQFESASFDFALTHIVLQHLPRRLAIGYLTEFMRLLKPGGHLVFQIPTRRIGRRARHSLTNAAPWLIRSYRRLRNGGAAAPHMEMRAVPEKIVIGTLARGAGHILAADPNSAAGPYFASATFYVAKNAPG